MENNAFVKLIAVGNNKVMKIFDNTFELINVQQTVLSFIKVLDLRANCG